MGKLKITLACWDHSRLRPIIDGLIQAEGIDLNCIPLPPLEIFWRMLKYEDFDAVAFNPSLPVNEAMEQVILGSEKGADLAYYLGSNPQEAARIANLPPMLSAMEMGKIEMKMSAPKKTTNAPKPIQPVGSGGSQNKDPSQMSTSEWMEWRNKQARGG